MTFLSRRKLGGLEKEVVEGMNELETSPGFLVLILRLNHSISSYAGIHNA